MSIDPISSELPKPTSSLYSEAEAHSVELSIVARALSYQVSEERQEGTLAGSVKSFFNKYKLEADNELQELIIDAMAQLTRADRVYDSERMQAYRAALPTLLKFLPTTPTSGYPVYQTTSVTGWLPGQIITVGIVPYELTGRRCPKCEINPQAYGAGMSGIRCVDQKQCRWNYCR